MPSTSDDLPAFPEEVLKACFCRLRLYEMQANSECLSLTFDKNCARTGQRRGG